MICVPIFYIKAYIVGTHLNYLNKLIKAYVVGTHLNCLDYKELCKYYTDYNLKPTNLLDCVLIGVCAVIRSNTVF